MKLDRNTNPDGYGKYALINMRKLAPFDNKHHPEIQSAISLLNRMGLITWGSESPGDQFFVMKYKDKFTAPALRAYAKAVREEAKRSNYQSLSEFAREIEKEAIAASTVGKCIPT